jgi:hypothetical protein
MNLFTFNNGDDYEETITDTKAISEASCEDKRRVRWFFIGVADGPFAGSPFE